MKALLAIAFIASSVAVSAPARADGSGDSAAKPKSEKKVCTRLEHRGASRLAYQRVCLTENEWRTRLGADWREILAGRSAYDDMEKVSTISAPVAETPAFTHSKTLSAPQ
jgi:hypothetical protein